MKVLVSIVTPVFNSAQFLEGTIKSILNQSYQDWEMLLIDGGSKDNSIEICRNYQSFDPRIKLIHNQDDKGPAHARYTGIKNSSGKYIAFIDADDLWLPDKLKIQIDKMEQEDLEFTYTLCRELQKDDKYMSIVLPTNRFFTFKQYLRKRGIYALTVVIKKDLLTEDIISIWNKDSYDDTLWWLLVMRKGITARLVAFDLALYRLSENQLSSRRGYTIKRVYSLYDYFSEINFLQKNLFFISYIFNSGFRHLKLKLFPKIKLESLTLVKK